MPVDRPWRARGVCRARRRRRPPRGTQLLPAGCRRNGQRGRHVIIRHQSAEYSRTDVFFLCHTCGTGRGRRLGRHSGRRGLRGRGRSGRIRLHRCERRRGASACSAAGVNATVGASAAEYKGLAVDPGCPGRDAGRSTGASSKSNTKGAALGTGSAERGGSAGFTAAGAAGGTAATGFASSRISSGSGV